MGLLFLLFLGAAVLVIAGTAAIVFTLLHPPRRTFAVALARGLPASPADLGLSYVEQRQRLPSGSATTLWIIEGGNPAGPTVILCHGWGESRFTALATAPCLATGAAQVILYDLRAHGDSTARRSDLGHGEVDDLLALMGEFTAQEDGRRPLVLMGLSMGGGISIAAAARAPHVVAGVIADSPPRDLLEPLSRYLRSRRLPVHPMAYLADKLLALMIGWRRDSDRVYLAGKLTCPLLVLHGTDDEVCPFASGEAIADAAPRGQLVHFAATHLDLHACDEERYAQAIGEFMDSLAEHHRVCQVKPGDRQQATEKS